MKSKYNNGLPIILGILLITISILFAYGYKDVHTPVKPIHALQDTLTCDVYVALNPKTNEAEHILIDTDINFDQTLDTIRVNNLTYIEDSLKDNSDIYTHSVILGVHLGTVKALPNGRLVSSIKYDDTDKGEDTLQ